MIIDRKPLRVAIFGSNNDKMYSGGRYHALIMAYAMAAQDVDVTIVTNRIPLFTTDLEPIAPGRVTYCITPDFETGLPQQPFDFVIVVPTGIFHPNSYESAFAFCQRSGARMMLLNFESANWFNAVAPSARDPRLWDYWRRAVATGGLVLSSARESSRHAQSFYRTLDGTPLRFEVCGPPINSIAADAALETPKDGSVVAFVRSTDAHKGGGDLLDLDPALLRGRILRIVVGGNEMDTVFQELLNEHFRDCELQFHFAVSDTQKFRLIAAAQAVLFPSRFEGFGYPPVEALYCGTEVVCYDLPVLRETVGRQAHIAPVGDVEAFGRQLAEALTRPERREELRASVETLVALQPVGLRLTDILLRSIDTVEPFRAIGDGVTFGPFEGAPPDPARPIAPVPPLATGYVRTPAGDLLLSLVLATRDEIRFVEADAARPDALGHPHLRLLDIVDGWRITALTALVSPDLMAERFALTLRDGGGDVLDAIAIELAEPAAAADRVDVQTEKGEPTGDGGFALDLVFGSTTSGDRVAMTPGSGIWDTAPVELGRASLRLRDARPEAAGPIAYLFRGNTAVAAFGGFPLMATARPATSGTLRSAEPVRLQIAELTDGFWSNGIARASYDTHVGALACHLPAGGAVPKPGDRVRLGSGRVLTVQRVIAKRNSVDLLFDEVLREADGAPGVLECLPAQRADLPVPQDFAAAGERTWQAGVLNVPGSLWRRAIVLTRDILQAMHSDRMPLLRFRKSGIRRVEHVFPAGEWAVLWLDSPLAADERLDYNPQILSGGRQFDYAENPLDGGWANGVRGAVIRLRPQSEPAIGDPLVFASGTVRRVVSIERRDDGLDVRLDAGIDAVRDGAPNNPRLASEAELAETGGASLRWRSEVPALSASPMHALEDSERRRGDFMGLAVGQPRTDDRPRILFASVVPPFPADQGNRTVTRNFIAHLVGLGFDVDLLLLGRVDPAQLQTEFGDRVRVFETPYPSWEEAPSAKLRRNLLADLRNARTGSDPGHFEHDQNLRLLKEAATYHPYFIVPDDFVRMGRALYLRHDYDSIVCNYTHTLRLAEELRPIRPLPPVAVITHDALSRLPLEYEGQPLDQSYRFCRPETERDVLDAVEGATVLAISQSELAYFSRIGVRNPTILCEYDGLEELRGYRVPARSFQSRRLLFHASGNPMNVAALEWFLRTCWPQILEAVPEARLLVCGPICRTWTAKARHMEMRGVLSRSDMLDMLQDCTLAINPTLTGTGLKIKTVEAACAGLPSVCLPAAVEGLEALADQFCRLATNEAEFARGCIELLSSFAAWDALRRSAVSFANLRFSETAIYGQLDRRMGWDLNRDERFARRRAPYGTPEQGEPIGADAAPAVRRQIALVDELEDLGLRDAAWSLLNRAASAQHSGRFEAALRAGERAVDTKRPMLALGLATSVLAYRPADLRALTLAAGIYRLLDDRKGEMETVRQLQLRAPFSDASAHMPGSAGREVPLDRPLRIGDIVPLGVSPGVGWAGAEPWGVWSTGPYARLVLAVPVSCEDLSLQATVAATPMMNRQPQEARIWANGMFLGTIVLAHDGAPKSFAATLPADSFRDARLVLEFFVRNPMPHRDEDGDIVDERRLGIALRGLTVSRAANASARIAR